MDSNDIIIHLNLTEGIGDGLALDVDAVLEAWKGQLKSVVLVGTNEAGAIVVASSVGSREANWLLDRAKLRVHGED